MAKRVIRHRGSKRSWFREVGYGEPPQWYLEDEVIDEDTEDFERQKQQVQEVLDSIEEDIDDNEE